MAPSTVMGFWLKINFAKIHERTLLGKPINCQNVEWQSCLDRQQRFGVARTDVGEKEKHYYMTSMKRLYSELFEAFKGKAFRWNKKQCTWNDFCHFVAMKGSQYDTSKLKFMVIGRATNGWHKITDESDIGEEAQKQFNCADGFDSWIVVNKYGNLRNNEKNEKTQKYYYLNRSSFWRTTKCVYMELSKIKDANWVQHIAWSNLYKIAPNESEDVAAGNPNRKMVRTQMEICKEILGEEINVYSPDYILFVTGWEWWFAGDKKTPGFDKILSGVKQESGNEFVVGKGICKLNDKNVKIVVTQRPEGKKENNYVNEILKCFNELEKSSYNQKG